VDRSPAETRRQTAAELSALLAGVGAILPCARGTIQAVRTHHCRRIERRITGTGSEGNRLVEMPACQRGGEPHTGMRNLAGWVARLRPRSLKAVVPAALPPTRSAHFGGRGHRGQWRVGPSRSGTRVLVPDISWHGFPLDGRRTSSNVESDIQKGAFLWTQFQGRLAV